MRRMSKKLKLALTLDELYTRYDNMLRDIYRRERAFYRKKQIAMIILEESNGDHRRLRIVEKSVYPDGTILVVR